MKTIQFSQGESSETLKNRRRNGLIRRFLAKLEASLIRSLAMAHAAIWVWVSYQEIRRFHRWKDRFILRSNFVLLWRITRQKDVCSKKPRSAPCKTLCALFAAAVRSSHLVIRHRDVTMAMISQSQRHPIQQVTTIPILVYFSWHQFAKAQRRVQLSKRN